MKKLPLLLMLAGVLIYYRTNVVETVTRVASPAAGDAASHAGRTALADTVRARLGDPPPDSDVIAACAGARLTVAPRTEHAIEYRLEQGAALALGVWSPSGEPIAGARVAIAADAGDREMDFTDAQGVVRFRGLATGGADVLIVCPGYAERIERVDLHTGFGSSPRPIYLGRAAPWTLAVGGAGGTPPPETRIAIERDGHRIVEAPLSDQEARQVLAEGRTYLVTISAPGFPARRVRWQVPLDVDPHLSIDLAPGGRILGTVRTPAGVPIDDASIVISQAGPMPSRYVMMPEERRARCRADGGFESALLAPGKYTLLARRGGHGVILDAEIGTRGASCDLGAIVLDPSAEH